VIAAPYLLVSGAICLDRQIDRRVTIRRKRIVGTFVHRVKPSTVALIDSQTSEMW
jgi:hypothetical protein